ncbi:hypothetical protein FB567DRAFT_255115 [Paraphoma chrysanthemicola]|uniref:Uncharacterized protein n=1 Tax=Paraphoma chrysanthemicola TaxID=798071 RepID=A0A8K0QTM6_9PLEO|nr:hypothetical protein FB567DRAFT_255115 [Paraphoma chrysanthemicola]
MRYFLLLVLATIVAFATAIPITPSAPRLQKRAEQFRLQGLKEFEIAERLSASAAETETFRSRVNHRFHSIFHTPSAEYDLDLFSGDIAPGSLDSPSMLPKAATDERDSFFKSLCALFHGSDRESFGYEGKEGEMRRPTGMRHWTQSFGGFRR